MKGFTRVPFDDAETGDLVVVPASAKGMHSSPRTLSSHGLKCGIDQARCDNSAKFVDKYLTKKAGSPAQASRFWVWNALRGETAPVKGANSLEELLTPKTILQGMALVPCGGRRPLPVRTADDGTIDCVWPVDPLMQAVKRLYKELPAKLEQTCSWWSRGEAQTGWRYLRALAESGLGAGYDGLETVPQSPGTVPRDRGNGGREPFRRVFAAKPASCPSWNYPTWGDRLKCEGRFIDFMRKQEVEVWRPSRETVDGLAKAVLRAHAQRCAKQLAAADASFAKAVEEIGNELGELRGCLAWWQGRAAELAEKEAADGED